MTQSGKKVGFIFSIPSEHFENISLNLLPPLMMSGKVVAADPLAAPRVDPFFMRPRKEWIVSKS